MSRVVVIGGGLIGLFTAYYLAEEGLEVTVLEKGDFMDNCSLGNAGMIVPSHMVPLASPGIIGKGLRWMLSSTSPFYIHPALDRRLLQWCLLFYRAATKKHVANSIPFLKNLSLLSKSLYQEIAALHGKEEIGLEEKGLVMLFNTKEAAEEEREFALLARQHGLEAEILSAQEAQGLEPHVQLDVLGGVLFPGDAHLDPGKLHAFLIRELRARGVRLHQKETVLGFKSSGQSLEAVHTDQGDYPADYVVVCAGSWSGEVARKLQLHLPMLAGKGYSFLAPNHPSIQTLAILTEARVAVTPYGPGVRFGGTMEITQANRRVNLSRVKGIHSAISTYYPGFSCSFPQPEDIWSGLRPCSPDGLPYLGKTGRWNNVLFGAGHSMMGLSLAPATGKILTNLVLNRESPLQIQAFSPDRYR
jgi:D-amino-acid dehydrogenase